MVSKKKPTIKQRESTLKKYGVTYAQYEEKWKKQQMACAICLRRKKPEGKAFAQDHNHASGEPRGILCMSCNKFLVGALEKCYKVPRPVLEGLVRYFEQYRMKGE